jgi:hypothetical protein
MALPLLVFSLRSSFLRFEGLLKSLTNSNSGLQGGAMHRVGQVTLITLRTLENTHNGVQKPPHQATA